MSRNYRFNIKVKSLLTAVRFLAFHPQQQGQRSPQRDRSIASFLSRKLELLQSNLRNELLLESFIDRPSREEFSRINSELSWTSPKVVCSQTRRRESRRLPFTLTFLASRLQKLQEPGGDSSDGVAGEAGGGQQEGQPQVEALLPPDVPALAPDQPVCGGLSRRRHGADQLLKQKPQQKP